MIPVDTTDAPFAVPPVIVLDLPAPPSVNRLRKIDWDGWNVARNWRNRADPMVLWNRSKRRGQPIAIKGKVELDITISEGHTGIDADNGLKILIDYLRRIGAIEDDCQKFVRKITVQFGEAPEGCRVVVRGIA